MVLEFEKPLVELEQKVEEMRKMADTLDISTEVNKLEAKINELRKNIFDNLTPWQIVQLARHPERPYTLDYIYLMTENFVELHGDRNYGDDKAVVGGFATIGDYSVMIIGQQKGRIRNRSLQKFRNDES